jgi:hypothetical protein
MFSGIKYGVLARSDGSFMRPVVWLTTDSSPDGHGLPTGKTRISAAEKAYVERAFGQSFKSDVTLDKTKVRVKARLATGDRRLVSFEKHCASYERPHFAKIMGLSARFDLQSLSDAELKRVYETARTKEKTWWLYAGVIEPEDFVAVDFDSGGTFVPYDFEGHGWAEFCDAGFGVVGKASLESLERILPPRHKFDQVKAFCLCQDADETPHFHIRGGGAHLAFRVEDGAPYFVKAGSPPDELAGWISERRAELRGCWNDARASYERYRDGDMTRKSIRCRTTIATNWKSPS